MQGLRGISEYFPSSASVYTGPQDATIALTHLKSYNKGQQTTTHIII